MSSPKPFYITTTLPYVNSDPHIGFAMEIIRADIIARAKKFAGYDVFFNTGTDEHGVKIYQRAKQENMAAQAYVDQAAERFRRLIPTLGILPDANFIRTTDEHHVMAAQAFWKLVQDNGDKADDGPYIYQKEYSVKYCIGCELEKTDSELVDGKCPLHPLQELENIQEKNYFFKFSAFGERLIELYRDNPTLVVPSFRFNEIKTFVEGGLQDFSISRLASKMPWGIPVPGDETQVMYVWFDALVNYVSAVGWPDRGEDFKKWWIDSGGVIQYCGKDNLRQQSAMWQAMLMAAGLPPTRSIIIDGFITGDGGIKMSKSLGNTVDPLDIVKDYGVDALRYYVARELSPFEDSSFTPDKFKEAYNAGLANGIGNLTSRIMKMAETNSVSFDPELSEQFAASPEMEACHEKQIDGFDAYNLQQACNAVWELVSSTDKLIQDRQPFKVIKENEEEGKAIIRELVVRLEMIGTMLLPILPETAGRILTCIKGNKMPAQPLFTRK